MKTSTMKQGKLKFEKAVMGAWDCLIANNYKVVQYGDNFFAFYAVDITREGKYQWGDSCFQDKEGKSKQYKTAKEAMKDCQIHADMDKKPWNYTIA